MNYPEPYIDRPSIQLHGPYVAGALGNPSLQWYGPLHAGLPYGCATYCTPRRTLVLRRLMPATWPYRAGRHRDPQRCEWPGCNQPALCSSGNFDNRLVCSAHFRVTNGENPALNSRRPLANAYGMHSPQDPKP